MSAQIRNGRWCGLAAAAALMLSAVVWAGDRDPRPGKAGQYDPNARTVEMFVAIEKGDIDVKLIQKDSTQAKVLIQNKTDKPLNVKLPDAFAGVPTVLAQAIGGAGGAGGGGGGRGGRNGGGGRGNQGTGGGMGGGGGGMMGGGGGGMFNVPPEQVGKFDVPTFCLDHGKAEPRPAVPYSIRPLESYTAKPGVRELCELFGKRKISQRAAQAAAWHLNNGMSWEQLSAKRLRYANGASRPYFTPDEIRTAMEVSATAVRMAEDRKKPDESRSGKPGAYPGHK